MLREDKRAGFGRQLRPTGRRWLMLEDGTPNGVWWRRREWQALQAEQAVRPAALFERDRRTYWLFEGVVMWEDEQLEADDVLALLLDRRRRALRRLQRARAALAGEAPLRRRPVVREVRQAVFERDGGRCVECGSAFEIQYDHVIPVALGGADTVENLQILCAPCNQAKGAALS